MKDLNTYLFSLFCGTLTALTVFLSIIITIDPGKTDVITKSAFFASLFLSTTGILSFLMLFVGSSILPRTPSQLLYSAVTHASLVSFAFVLALVLQTMRVLGWWELFIIVLLVVIIELFIRSQKRETA